MTGIDDATARAIHARLCPGPYLPKETLSVRQPWAWAIIHAGKTHENRTEASIRLGGMREVVGRRICIHAGKGMTRDEYEEAAEFIRRLAGRCPPAADLERGGIIGTVRVSGLITTRLEREAETSPWFFGPCALLLADAEPCGFVGADGQLGMFRWQASGRRPVPPARWMRPSPAAEMPAQGKQGELL